MQFSGTFSPSGAAFAGVRRQAAQDPIAEARQLLHAAARVPFAAARPLQWRTSFAQHVGAAREALHRHISRSARGDSPMSEIERDEPRLKPVIERQRAEHGAYHPPGRRWPAGEAQFGQAAGQQHQQPGGVAGGLAPGQRGRPQVLGP